MDDNETETRDMERDAYGTDPVALEAMSEAEVMELVVERITQIQASIDTIAANAAARIKKRKGYLDFLLMQWLPKLKQYARTQIEARGKKSNGSYKQKYADLGVGKIFATQTGGWAIDRKVLTDWLLDHPLRASEFGLQPYLRYPKGCMATIKATMLDSGEVLPGAVWVNPDPLGKITIGAVGGWSSDKASKAISTALGRTQHDHFAADEDEE